jgi:hypothetical protein
MEYLIIENGVIKEHSCGPVPDGGVEVSDFCGVVGDPVSFYDQKWERKPFGVLVKEGVIKTPAGMKLNDSEDGFAEMTESEKIASGAIKPNEYQKLENGAIIQKTPDEMLADKVITAEQYNEIIVNKRRAAYAKESDPVFWDYQRGDATKAEWLAAVKAVKEQLPKVKE